MTNQKKSPHPAGCGRIWPVCNYYYYDCDYGYYYDCGDYDDYYYYYGYYYDCDYDYYYDDDDYYDYYDYYDYELRLLLIRRLLLILRRLLHNLEIV